MRPAALVVWIVVALAAAHRPARADLANAWTAAQTHMPRSTAVVVGIDAGAITRSAQFGPLYSFMVATQRDVQRGLELVKTRCKLDPQKLISGIVVGSDANQKRGVMFLQLAGIDQRAAQSCVDAVARAVLGGTPDAKLASRKVGALLEISLAAPGPEPLARRAVDKQRDVLHVAWIQPSVLAIPLDIDDQVGFQQWLNNRSAFKQSPIGKALATIDKRAAVFAASSVADHLDLSFARKLAYGAITIGKTNLLADLRIVVDTPGAATAAVNRLNFQLKDFLARAKLSKNVESILRSVLISDQHSEVSISTSVPEANLLELLVALAR